MIKKNVFDFDDYKAFILAFEGRVAPLQRGFRTRLAEGVGCQPAFVSQVLGGSAHFSLEQALKAANHLQLPKEESKFFITLVEYGRAGDKELRAYFFEQLQEMRQARLEISHSVGPKTELSPEAQATYYSHWHYAAIHILVTIPRFQIAAAISDALKIEKQAVDQILLFLLNHGLIREQKGKFLPGSTQVHLSRASPNIVRHHTNWRLSAIEHLTHSQKTDVHYSTVSSLSRKDAEEIQKRLVEMISEYVEKVRDSKEETLFGFNVDFFELIR